MLPINYKKTQSHCRFSYTFIIFWSVSVMPSCTSPGFLGIYFVDSHYSILCICAISCACVKQIPLILLLCFPGMCWMLCLFLYPPYHYFNTWVYHTYLPYSTKKSSHHQHHKDWLPHYPIPFSLWKTSPKHWKLRRTQTENSQLFGTIARAAGKSVCENPWMVPVNDGGARGLDYTLQVTNDFDGMIIKKTSTISLSNNCAQLTQTMWCIRTLAIVTGSLWCRPIWILNMTV